MMMLSPDTYFITRFAIDAPFSPLGYAMLIPLRAPLLYYAYCAIIDIDDIDISPLFQLRFHYAIDYCYY
jgi:hypothetical protein